MPDTSELDLRGLRTLSGDEPKDEPFPGWETMLGVVTGPYHASQKILSGVPIDQITGEDTMALGSVMVPGYGRAMSGTRALGTSGGSPTRPTALISALRGNPEFEAMADQIFMELKDFHADNVMPAALTFNQLAKGYPVEAARGARLQASSYEKQLGETAERLAAERYYTKQLGTTDFELGSSGGSVTRGSKFWNPTPAQVEDFWRRAIAYRGDLKILAKYYGVTEHTIAARMASPVWARQSHLPKPPAQASQPPPMLTGIKNPTPEDVRNFWNFIDMFQSQRGWAKPAAAQLGITEKALGERFSNPKWKRPVPEGEASVAGVPAPQSGDGQTVEQFYGP